MDYLEREASNRNLGAAGEEFVIKFERARLTASGKETLAERIEHVSVTKGDQACYDIRSFEVNGKDRLIEAKTTKYGIDTPFYITANELRFSESHRNNYQLYRVFEFRKKPRLFTLFGYIKELVDLSPTSYLARI